MGRSGKRAMVLCRYDAGDERDGSVRQPQVCDLFPGFRPPALLPGGLSHPAGKGSILPSGSRRILSSRHFSRAPFPEAFSVLRFHGLRQRICPAGRRERRKHGGAEGGGPIK